MFNKRFFMVLITVVTLLFMVTSMASMESKVNYPQKPIKIIIPWAAGGSTDMIGRALSAVAEKYLGQPLVVVNRAGAAGTIAVTEVKGAKPDGYTVLLAAIGLFTTQPKMRHVEYALDDFEPVIGVSYEPIILVTNPESGYKSLDDLKNSGKTIKYSSSGTGGLNHLAQAALYKKMGIKADHVPCKGDAPAIMALLGNHVDSTVAHPANLLPYLKSGKLLFLGVFSPERCNLMKDVPTLKEQGYDLDFSVSKFILVPKGVDTSIIKILHDKFFDIMKDPEFTKFTKNTHLEITPISGEKLLEKLRREIINTGRIIDDLGLTSKNN